MLNETLNATQIVVQTPVNIWQSLSYIIPLALFLVLFSLRPAIQLVEYELFTWRRLRRLSRLLDKNVVVMCHSQAGLFGSMITMNDVMKFESLLRKFKRNGKAIMFIVNTFGGDLLASIRLARLVKQNDVEVWVPKYAWSGGSLVSLASSHIVMDSNATLSPVDPQLGTFLKIYSAKYWMEILKRKGTKAADETIAMARMSKEIMDEEREVLDEILPKGVDRKKVMDYFLSGKRTHAFQISLDDLNSMGFNASTGFMLHPELVSKALGKKEVSTPMVSPEMELCHRIVEKSGKEGVFGYVAKSSKS